MNDADRLVSDNIADNCSGAYAVASSYLKQGDYEKGKAMMMKILDGCYDAMVSYWGKSEKLRTLAASELALYAGGQGDYEAIEWIEKKVAKDAAVDRVLVRDAKGILKGKTKLRDVVRFHKARAYAKASMPDKAKAVLKELAFASGKVFVDDKVQGMKEAISRLQGQIAATAELLFRFWLVA